MQRDVVYHFAHTEARGYQHRVLRQTPEVTGYQTRHHLRPNGLGSDVCGIRDVRLRRAGILACWWKF
jgi:tRNA (Thr-GGU) A37 N-methylase